MNPLTVGMIVTVFAFGGAILGMMAGAILPKHHLSAESKDVIKVAMAMTATIAALLVSLLISAAKSSFDEKDNELREQAARTIMLDRLLAQYGPETRETRALLRTMVEDQLRSIWGEGTASGQQAETDLNAMRKKNFGMEALQDRLLDLSPTNDKQGALKAKALDVSYQIVEDHWRLVEQLEGRIQKSFLGMLTFWLTIVFMSFGLFAPRNTSVIAALCVGALSVGTAIYMIVEMDSPYGGFITISSAPIHAALDQLGR